MSERQHLEFEKPIVELEKKISDMRDFSLGENLELSSEITSLEEKLEKLRKDIYSNLTRWEKVQISRHPKRPYSLDYINLMTTEFIEIHGDRFYSDDKAMIGGFARIDGKPVMMICQQKGRSTKEKLYRNFGMMHPEGYRKAMRLFKMAEKFDLPIIVLIDTPGAYPGIEAEERGQAEAIARNIRDMSRIKVPIICIIIGEGASGGALGVGMGDKLMMLEYAWYSVISPEGCAAILWRDAAKASEAAEALKVTSGDLVDLGIIDLVIPEPPSGAHNDHQATSDSIKKEIIIAINELRNNSIEELLDKRIAKYRKMGEFKEN